MKEQLEEIFEEKHIYFYANNTKAELNKYINELLLTNDLDDLMNCNDVYMNKAKEIIKKYHNVLMFFLNMVEYMT